MCNKNFKNTLTQYSSCFQFSWLQNESIFLMSNFFSQSDLVDGAWVWELETSNSLSNHRESLAV